jgi:hypothetical protein
MTPMIYNKKGAKAVNIRIHSIFIKQFLNYCGLKNVHSNAKEIPWVILQSPKEIVQEYLKAYFEGDGGVSGKNVEVSTASEKMSKQLQTVLSNFGIIVSRSSSYKAATNGFNIKRLYFRLSILGENVDVFKQELGFISSFKNRKLIQILGLKRNTNVHIIPFIKTPLIEQYHKYKNKTINSHNCAGLKIFGRKKWELMRLLSTVKKQRLTYDQLKLFSDDLPNAKLLLSHNFFFAPIISIVKSKTEVVDFSIPKVHNFISNSFVSHNSQIVKQVADELNIGFIDLRLSQLEPGDLVGIPYIKDGRTHWGKPEWWPEPGTRGILFLDELNRAPNDVRQSVFQVVLDRRLHTHVLPDGWLVCAAINPDNSNYQVESLDIAMIRRFCPIVITPDVDTWMLWAVGSGKISSEITGFAAAHKQLMYFHEEISLETKPSFDQYTLLNRIRESGSIPAGCDYEIYAGMIGKEAATAFRKWLDSNYDKPVSGEDVLNKYEILGVELSKQIALEIKQVKADAEKAKKEITQQEAVVTAYMAVRQQNPKLPVTNREKLLKQRNDETYATLSELLALMENIQKPPKKQSDNLIQFLLDVSAETKATVVKRLPHTWLTAVVADERVTEDITRILREAQGKK